MEGVTAWYVILSVLILFTALMLRFSTYTFLVRQSRYLPEKAGRLANLFCLATLISGAVVLIGKALFFSR